MNVLEFRKALPVHHTDTSDGPWDGPQMRKNLRNDETAKYYRQAFAWVDPEGDPNVKSSYKFIHHEVNSDGEIGAANVRACVAGIAILNGARGGTTIPQADREGVYRHLAAHIRDADQEPPELLSRPVKKRGVEFYREFELREVRAAEDGQRKIGGYAAVFDQETDIGGFFREVIRPGAFKKTLQESDVLALWNHDTSKPLGRVSNGTLELTEDERGLRFELQLPDTTWGVDAFKSISRGDVRGMSFGFVVTKESWSGKTEENGKEDILREIKEVALYEISPVTFPAYEATEVEARAILAARGIEVSEKADSSARSGTTGEPGRTRGQDGRAQDPHSAAGRREHDPITAWRERDARLKRYV